MAEIEIIKTDDENIVIVRTTLESEVNIDELNNKKSNLLDLISNLTSKINVLKGYENSEDIKELVENEILDLTQRINFTNDEINKIDEILNNL